MGNSEDNEKQKQAASASGQSEIDKKNYQAPKLHEYGNVTTMTQDMMTGSLTDSGVIAGMTRMMA